jgi:outer membrane protein assembly factor BamB
MVAAVAVAAGGAVRAQDLPDGWPMAGGDAAHSGSAPGPEPPYAEAWSVPVPGGVADGPVVADGLVVAVGRDRVVAVDSGSGDVTWEAERAPGPTGSPAVEGGVVVHASGDDTASAVVARSLDDGREVWRAFPGSPVRAAIVIEGQHAYVTTLDGTVLALRLRDGQEVWRRPLGGTSRAAPAVAGGLVLAVVLQRSADTGLSTTVLVALDASTGEEEWRFATDPASASATPPAVSGDLAVFGGGDSEFHGIDMATGDELWSSPSEAAAILQPPAFSGSQVPAGVGDPILLDLAHVQRLAAATGEQRWSFRVIDGLLRSGATVVGGYVLVGDLSGGLSAIDSGSGVLVWTRDLGSGSATTAAADGRRVYVGLTGRRGAGSGEGRSIEGRLVALEQDPDGHLERVESTSTLFPVRAVLSFGLAAVAVAALSLLVFRVLLRPRTEARGS